MVNLGDDTDQIIANLKMPFCIILYWKQRVTFFCIANGGLHFTVLEMEGYTLLYWKWRVTFFCIGNGGLHFSVLEMGNIFLYWKWRVTLYCIGNGGLHHFSLLMWTNLIIFFLVFIDLSVRPSVCRSIFKRLVIDKLKFQPNFAQSICE